LLGGEGRLKLKRGRRMSEAANFQSSHPSPPRRGAGGEVLHSHSTTAPTLTSATDDPTPRPRRTASDLDGPGRRYGVVLTAVLWWLASQQWGWFAFGWIALTPLFWALDGLATRARWRLGYAAGFLGYALINWWIAPTIARGSPMIGVSPVAGMALGIFSVAFIAAVHGLQVALVAAVWNPAGRLAQRASWSLPILIAVLWTAVDVVRCESVIAHPWGALAYTQWPDTALLQSVAVIGQHGLTALCVWFAASLALWMRRDGAVLWLAPVLVFLTLHVWGAWRLAQPMAISGVLRVLLVQTNVPSLRKNNLVGGESEFSQVWRLTQAAARRGQFDLIVWPETTVEIVSRRANEPAIREGEAGRQIRAIDTLSHTLQTCLLFGARRHSVDDRGNPTIRNDAVLVTPNGVELSSAKQHLVPFGERAPFGEYWPFLRRFAPRPEMSPALEVENLSLPAMRQPAPVGSRPTGSFEEGISIGTLICFESCFFEPARSLRRAGAQALFVLTNDEWFLGTNVPWQHAAMATVRAVENGVAVAQVANGGYSFVVDARGRFMVNPSHSTRAISTPGQPQAVPVIVPLS
ncbi:MAG: apolipoprotein N-acyltransferase, partial [Armatimonadota bacterium]|nr:apolipoprotein N-acyltransferase [Armatimonadota bacterium]